MRLLARLTRPLCVAASIFGMLAVLGAFAASGDTVADRVFGQAGSFTTHTANNGGVSASSLSNPSGVAIDSAGHFYVADQLNNRVLEYDSPLTSQTAARVFGQGGSFTTSTANNGGVSANSLNQPVTVAVDSGGRLYVADANNNRVLEYDSPLTSQTATRVFGQAGSFTTNSNGGLGATSLTEPQGVTVDSLGRLYVADYANSRVLEYDSPLTSQTATRVFGQAGSFTTNTANNGGISASSLWNPTGMVVDSAAHLYIADFGNNRVLEYDSPLTSQTATRVFGQAGSFTTNTANNGGISASSLSNPTGMGVDSAARLYIADAFNNRVLEYDNPLASQTATRVFGQGDSFTTNVGNGGDGGASSLLFPIGVAVGNAADLYVADAFNNRVLEYDTPVQPPPSVGGVAQQPAISALPSRTSASSGYQHTTFALAAAAVATSILVAGGTWAARRRHKLNG